MTAARADRFATVILVCAATLLVSGCSGGDKDPSPSSDPSGSAAGGQPVPVQAEVGKVTGRLKPTAATAAVDGIGPVVDGWFEAAYVGGDFPRADFPDAFPGFTKGAAKDAEKDAVLMTNQEIGADVEGVTADLKQVKVDLLAADRKAAGATARFTLVFTTTGTYAKEVTVKGQLFLTPDSQDAWQVFGYNVTRSSR
jgi:outer membrane murein-binding lipoprotein Lpp